MERMQRARMIQKDLEEQTRRKRLEYLKRWDVYRAQRDEDQKVMAAIQQEQTSVKFFLVGIQADKILKQIYSLYAKRKAAIFRWKVQC